MAPNRNGQRVIKTLQLTWLSLSCVNLPWIWTFIFQNTILIWTEPRQIAGKWSRGEQLCPEPSFHSGLSLMVLIHIVPVCEFVQTQIQNRTTKAKAFFKRSTPAPSLLKEIFLPEELKTRIFASESTTKPFSYLLNMGMVLVVVVNALWVLAELIPQTLHGLSIFSYLAVDFSAEAQRKQSWAWGSTAREPPQWDSFPALPAGPSDHFLT